MIKPEMYDVAVILINYNSSFHSINCINSILEHTSKTLNYQIIISDNASEEKDYLHLKEYCDKKHTSKIKLYRSKINTGFGGGNMFGVQFANAKYLAFLNNDTLLMNDCLTLFKNYLDNNKDVGVAGGQAFKKNGTFMVCTDHFASPLTEIFGKKILEKINTNKYPKRKAFYEVPTRVNFVSGSFMFTRTEDFNEVGGFDTNLFLYHEESDLCKRLLNISKYSYLIPEAKFIHLHGASTPKSLAIKKELKISLLYVIRKHYGYFGHRIVISYLIFKYFFSSFIKPKKWPLFFLVFRGAPLYLSLKTSQKIKNLS
jgi:GT2 family glycosyltransferase